jgi:cytochrome c biogenesis protein CcmG/thiol:disulfide interchange protein DsbE
MRSQAGGNLESCRRACSGKEPDLPVLADRSPRRPAGRWIAAPWLIALALIVVFIAVAARHWVTPGPALDPDQPAPDIALTAFSGQRLTSMEWRGRPVVVNFWASWCGDCPADSALLERLWSAERARGLVVVGVAMHEVSPERGDIAHNPKAYVNRLRLTYPNGYDRSGEIAARFGVSGAPETVFIDRDGRIVGRHVGPLTEADLRRLVTEATDARGTGHA